MLDKLKMGFVILAFVIIVTVINVFIGLAPMFVGIAFFVVFIGLLTLWLNVNSSFSQMQETIETSEKEIASAHAQQNEQSEKIAKLEAAVELHKKTEAATKEFFAALSSGNLQSAQKLADDSLITNIFASAANEICMRITSVKTEISAANDAVKSGSSNKRLTTANLSGDWAHVANSINEIFDTQQRNLSTITETLERIEKGDISRQSTSGASQGEYAAIYNAINKVIASMSQLKNEKATLQTSLDRATNDLRMASERAERAAAAPQRQTLAQRMAEQRNAQSPMSTLNSTPPPRNTILNRNTTPTLSNPARPADTGRKSVVERAQIKPPPLGLASPVNTRGGQGVNIPSGAHVYQRKDFGKY